MKMITMEGLTVMMRNFRQTVTWTKLRELGLFQNLSRIVNRYWQGKVKDLLVELQEIIIAAGARQDQ